MKYFLDTEFVEDGKTIDLISIGVVAEDGREFYAVNAHLPSIEKRANQFVRENVLPNLYKHGDVLVRHSSPEGIGKELLAWVGADKKPEFWGWYADYDWVVFCQLFGRMIDLPKHFPRYCRDLKQWADDAGNPQLPKEALAAHNAIVDARWNRMVYAFLDINFPRK